MTAAVIVQARMRSTRLPGKVLLPLSSGFTVIEEVLGRARLIKGARHVVAALSDDPASDIITEIISYMLAYDPDGTHIVRGSENDVISRYIAAAEVVGADTIMRVTSDCPLIDPDVCSLVLDAYKNSDVDYCTNAMPRSWPHGLDCEVFSIDLLKRAALADETKYPGNREGVDVWMQHAPEVRRLNVEKDGPSEAHIRWTLDTIDDYVTIFNEHKRRMGTGKGALCA